MWLKSKIVSLHFLCGFHTNLIDEHSYAEGIGKLSTADGKAFADPEVLRRLTSSVSCALDEAAAALTRMRAENNHNAGQVDKYAHLFICLFACLCVWQGKVAFMIQ